MKTDRAHRSRLPVAVSGCSTCPIPHQRLRNQLRNGSFTGNQAVVLGLASGHGLMKVWALADDEGQIRALSPAFAAASPLARVARQFTA